MLNHGRSHALYVHVQCSIQQGWSLGTRLAYIWVDLEKISSQDAYMCILTIVQKKMPVSYPVFGHSKSIYSWS